MTRRPESAAARELQSLGAEVMKGDLDDAASLAPVLTDVWGAFAVQNTWEAGVEREEEQGKRFADLAKATGVQHVVYTSVGSAHRGTGIPHFENKWRIEERVRELGFPSTVIIRPVFFMENLLAPDTKAAVGQGTLPFALRPDTRLQMIAVQDVGKYGRIAFEHAEQLNGRAIDLAGDELTFTEAAAVLSRVTGHPVRHQQLPIEAIRSFSEDYAIMLEWFESVGYDADIAGNAREFGVPATRFEEWARTHFA